MVNQPRCYANVQELRRHYYFSDMRLLVSKILELSWVSTIQCSSTLTLFSHMNLGSFSITNIRLRLPHITSQSSLITWGSVGSATNEDAIEDDNREESTATGHSFLALLQSHGNSEESPGTFWSYPVDGKATCSWHLDYTEHPQSGSLFCNIHHIYALKHTFKES